MRRKKNRLFQGTAALILVGCLFFQGIGESVAEAAFPVGIAEEAASLEAAAAKKVLCEESFEAGTVGEWSSKEGAIVSV